MFQIFGSYNEIYLIDLEDFVKTELKLQPSVGLGFQINCEGQGIGMPSELF